MGAPIKELKLPEKLPEWFVIMPGDATLTVSDLTRLLGVSVSFIHRAMADRHLLPPPDYKMNNSFKIKTVNHWKKSTIINFFEDRRNGQAD